MGGTADAPPPPPPSGHSCSWRELSQRFSWFCLKLLSPPGERDQADILVRHPEVSNILDPPFFRAQLGATRTGGGSIVPATTVTVTDAGHGCQRQGWHESAALIVLSSTRLTVPRYSLTDKHASVQHQCAGAASPTSPWEEAKGGKKKDKRHFCKKENVSKTTGKWASSTPKQRDEPARTVF